MSCSSDEQTVTPISAQEANTHIATFNDKASSDVQELIHSTGLNGLNDLFELTNVDDPFGRRGFAQQPVQAWFRTKAHAFREIFVSSHFKDGRNQSEPFNFLQRKGVYTWSPKDQAFLKKAESDVIMIEYPAGTSATNNAVLIISDYYETKVFDQTLQSETYQPERIVASLSIDDTEQVALNLFMKWDTNGFPVRANVIFTVKPFQTTIQFDVGNEKMNALGIQIKRNAISLFSSNLTVRYSDQRKSQESITKVEGYVKFHEVKLEGEINVEATRKADVNWDEIIQLSLYHDERKLGDVVMIEDANGAEAFLKYNDGTTERLETVMMPFIDQFNELKLNFE